MEHRVPPENLILRSEQLAEVAEHYSQVEAFAFDVETTGDDRLNPRKAVVTWLCLATDTRCDVIPMGHPHGDLISERPALLKSGQLKMEKGKTYEELKTYDLSRRELDRIWSPKPEQLSRTEVFTALADVFQSEAVKVGHNIKFDLHNVAKYLKEMPAPPYFDTHIASWLLDVTKKGRLGLGEVCRRFLDFLMVKGVGENVVLHGFNEVANYSYLDGRYTWLLYRNLLERYATLPANIQALLQLEMDVLEPVVMMEDAGIRIDTEELRRLESYFADGIEIAKATAVHLARRTFNLNSNVDKQTILFSPKAEGGQGLKPTLLTDGGVKKRDAGIRPEIGDYSTKSEALEDHLQNPVVAQLAKYAAFSKLQGTYVVAYLGGEVTKTTNGKAKLVQVPSQLIDGRIYGRFNQTGAESGRFSSSEPNLQNIPSRSEEGKKLRKIFLPDEGHLLICADYSQIEPRVIASLSKDTTMLTTYREGGDIYLTVSERLGVSRPVGKELVLSMSYGVGSAKIAARTGLKVKEAKELLEYFAQHFRSIPEHKTKVIAQARRNRYACTIYGRKRQLPGLFWRDEDARAKAERQAYNHTIQGSAADLMKFALVKVYDALVTQYPAARLLLTVHDEVVITAPADQAEAVAVLVKSEMESVGKKLLVPLVADVHVGDSWADAKK